LKSFVVILGFLILSASTATWSRFHSFDPCIWMEKEMSEQSGMPFLAAEAKVQTDFIHRGIASPTATQCVGAWWRFRMEGAMSQKQVR
jgi:hypothetical protein